MTKSFIIFSSAADYLEKVRSVTFLTDYDVFIAYDIISLCTTLERRNRPRCVFIDINNRSGTAAVQKICEERNIPHIFFDPHTDRIERLLPRSESAQTVPPEAEIDVSSADRFFIGSSKPLSALKKSIVLAAKSDLPILLVGENGTGKTLAARAIHTLSTRKRMPFFDVNMAAIPDLLSESELFGSVSGGFTDAKNRPGYFKSADKGTIFLDEIGEMNAYLQAKLLKVLDSGEFRSVGSDTAQTCDVRVISATNANLKKKMTRNEFREDLYYRIAGLEIRVPSLRERKSDIPSLCRHFLGGSGKFLSKPAEDFLSMFDWPGNIRQLENCMKRAALLSLARSEIGVKDIIF